MIGDLFWQYIFLAHNRHDHGDHPAKASLERVKFATEINTNKNNIKVPVHMGRIAWRKWMAPCHLRTCSKNITPYHFSSLQDILQECTDAS